MRKLLFLLFFITALCVNAETWQEYRNRVEVMSKRVADRVVDGGFLEGEYWQDEVAAIWATHDWCYFRFKYILENDNTMTQNIRNGRALLMFLHDNEREKMAEYASKISNYNWIRQRYDYWYKHLDNGGLINFKLF